MVSIRRNRMYRPLFRYMRGRGVLWITRNWVFSTGMEARIYG